MRCDAAASRCGTVEAAGLVQIADGADHVVVIALAAVATVINLAMCIAGAAPAHIRALVAAGTKGNAYGIGQTLAKATPLWHGVDLTRMLTLDTVELSAVLIHVAYLTTLAVLGWFWAVRRLTKRMSN